MRYFCTFLIAAILPISSGAEEPDYSKTLGELSARITNLEEENRSLYGRIEELEYKLREYEQAIPVIDGSGNEYISPSAEYLTHPGEESEYVIKVPNKNELEPQKRIRVIEAEQLKPMAPPEVSSVSTLKPEEMPKLPYEKSNELEGPIPFKLAPSEGEEAEYNEAFQYLGKEDYNAAEKAFNDFLTKYPESDFLPEVYFWLGEVSFSRDEYSLAAVSYLKGYKKDPKHKKAPENIAKLAESLKKLGKKAEACKNYARFKTEFPNAHQNLKEKAANARSQLGCKS